eukprot:555071-Pleurochrysis_carterae.AAC.4
MDDMTAGHIFLVMGLTVSQATVFGLNSTVCSSVLCNTISMVFAYDRWQLALALSDVTSAHRALRNCHFSFGHSD